MAVVDPPDWGRPLSLVPYYRKMARKTEMAATPRLSSSFLLATTRSFTPQQRSSSSGGGGGGGGCRAE
jgi:hypothetical protein